MIVVTTDRIGNLDVACGECDRPLALIIVAPRAAVRYEDDPCECGSFDELRLLVGCARASDDARRRVPLPAGANGLWRRESAA